MPLLTFWASSKDAVLKMSIAQIVASAGNGVLRDGDASSSELREFLKLVDAEALEKYAAHCLTQRFNDSGFVLQDVVNELGRRLGYKVSNGLYRGRPNAIGYDGIWQNASGRPLVVEVKTTDHYNIDLSKAFSYRDKLVAQGAVGHDAAVLFVVGRDDSNSLEAQIRGSRHAWDARLVSVDALVKMVKVRESTDDQATSNRLRALLEPVEYTRVDRLIDVVFEAVVDAQSISESEAPLPSVEQRSGLSEGVESTPTTAAREEIENKREQSIEAISRSFGCVLTRESRTAYVSEDGGNRFVIAVSKRYPGAMQAYWYAYHSYWQSFLEQAETSGYFVLACMDKNEVYAIPASVLTPLTGKMSKSEKYGRTYRHIVLQEDGDGLALRLTAVGEVVPLAEYRVPLLTPRP